MDRLHHLIGMIPAFDRAGLLELTGGGMAVRGNQGIYITPTQAAEELSWNLKEEDFVLFPGEGDASMARAGRRPSRDNRIHREMLHERTGWNYSYLGYPWGLLGFAMARRPLPIPVAHASLFHDKELQIPVSPDLRRGSSELGDFVKTTIDDLYRGDPYGAVLIAQHGVLVAGKELEPLLALVQLMENLARAQHWMLGRDEVNE